MKIPPINFPLRSIPPKLPLSTKLRRSQGQDNNSLDNQAYASETVTAETQLQAIEEIATEIAYQLKKVKRIPTKRELRSRLGPTFGALATVLAPIGISFIESNFDATPIADTLKTFISNSPYAFISASIAAGVVTGVTLANRQKDKVHQKQAKILARLAISNYSMFAKREELRKQGNKLFSLSPEQAKRLEIALGGEKRSKNPFTLAYRFVTRRKRGGHLFLPGIFNGALTIDYLIEQFYQKQAKTSHSQKVTRSEIDQRVINYLIEYTYHDSLAPLITNSKPRTIISEDTYKDNTEKNRLRAQGIVAATKLPFEEQTFKADPNQTEPQIEQTPKKPRGKKPHRNRRMTEDEIQKWKDKLKAEIIEELKSSVSEDLKEHDEVDPEVLKVLENRLKGRPIRTGNIAGGLVDILPQTVEELPESTQDRPDQNPIIGGEERDQIPV